MRGILFVSVLSLILSIAGLGWAAPSGGPAASVLIVNTYPVKGEAVIDVVFEREFDLAGDNAVAKTTWYLGKIGITPIEKIDIYALMGTVDFKVENWTVNNYDLEADITVAWGTGAKLLLYETGEYGDGVLRVTVDGNYRQYEPGIEKVKKNEATLSGIAAKELKYREWQTSLGFSYTLDSFTPYIGVKYSDVECKLKINDGGTVYKDTANSKNVIGILIGVDYLSAENIFVLNFEGRFIDETALSVSVKMNF